MNADFGIDLDEIRRVIDAADVLVIRFSITSRRLLVDARTSDDEGPMIKVVPAAASAEERFRSLKVLRPRFHVPDRILTFHWPRHCRSMATCGIWDHLARRLVALGWSGTAGHCDAAFAEIVEEERLVEIAAIRGAEGFQTLWQADHA
ncbi:MAG: hypothetical protein IVW36_02785 [Dehalococcoidia bacterium]|nr:hypothetical protein [Dehalococcoidia bacterium]